MAAVKVLSAEQRATSVALSFANSPAEVLHDLYEVATEAVVQQATEAGIEPAFMVVTVRVQAYCDV